MFSFSQSIIFACLGKIQGGQILLKLPDGSSHIFGTLDKLEPHSIEVTIFDTKVFQWILSKGDIGVAEGFFKGLWDTNDLEELLILALKNRSALENLIYGSWFGSLIYKIKHFFNKNTKAGSKRNIQAHYDLGNKFYELWLDPSMIYSSATFGDSGQKSLQQAQQDKCQRILELLQNKPGESILEIGCGWGGFMKEALSKDLNVDGITISQEQFNYVSQSLALTASNTDKNQGQVLLQDYRECSKQYDGIASIEMFEAVGEAYWPSYFASIYRCLKPGKRAVIQSIVIDDLLFYKYRTNTDFIQQYVFPGGMLPSVFVFEKHAVDVGLKIKDKFFFGNDYSTTLRIWADSFNDKVKDIKALGFKDEFIRLWNFYLMYCSAGFTGKTIDVVQFTLEKPIDAT
ncbi:MAG: cyclopropane-fatty-acyl-phospholipid synthase family protein [Betaproteobacteria bacterium]